MIVRELNMNELIILNNEIYNKLLNIKDNNIPIKKINNNENNFLYYYIITLNIRYSLICNIEINKSICLLNYKFLFDKINYNILNSNINYKIRINTEFNNHYLSLLSDEIIFKIIKYHKQAFKIANYYIHFLDRNTILMNIHNNFKINNDNFDYILRNYNEEHHVIYSINDNKTSLTYLIKNDLKTIIIYSVSSNNTKTFNMKLINKFFRITFNNMIYYEIEFEKSYSNEIIYNNETKEMLSLFD